MSNPWSNAPAGYPDTSASGYPLWYAIGVDGQPVGPPRLAYDGQTFADEVELESYKVRTKARDENLEAWRKAHEAETHSGHFAAGSLVIEEMWYLWWKGRGKDDSFWKRMIQGSNADIARVKQAAFYSIPAGWDGRAWFRDNTRIAAVPELWP